MTLMGKLAKAYSSSLTPSQILMFVGAMTLIGFLMLLRGHLIGSNTSYKKIEALTWNMAAINNNPFEYWITSENPTYNQLMKDVSEFIDNPGDRDVPVSDVFTTVMFDSLYDSMVEVGWPVTGLEEVKARWHSDFKNRKIISSFIKDAQLGKKRLASMPDRVTNTITTVNEGIVTRPTVINCYSGGDLGTMEKWWAQWTDFMFKKKISVRKKGAQVSLKLYELLAVIKHSKYPSITPEEEAISVPLQTLCGAIFDAILVYMMNQLAPKNWQELREEMCEKLNRKKNERAIEILESTYAEVTVGFLQEVSASFVEKTSNRKIGQLFDVLYSSAMDSDRDQNSFILLKKNRFVNVKELTNEVMAEFSSDQSIPMAAGDLFVLQATDALDGNKYLLASFHGDTNGLATIPILTAVHSYAVTKRKDHKLLFGMDANTYENPEKDQQGVTAFATFYKSKHLNSCYGPNPNPKNYTTFHARTHLQPQLNKAVAFNERATKGDKNPKDFIIFFDSDFKVLRTHKDNTGQRKYTENMVFPTLSFPSDHGITSTVLMESSVTYSVQPSLRKAS